MSHLSRLYLPFVQHLKTLMLQNQSNGERLKRESRRYICNNENLDMVNTKQTFIISFCVLKEGLIYYVPE